MGVSSAGNKYLVFLNKKENGKYKINFKKHVKPLLIKKINCTPNELNRNLKNYSYQVISIS